MRFKSSRNHGEKSVRKDRYSIITQHPQKKQKLPKAGELANEPMKKERPSVTEVIVIDGPACVSPALNLSLALR